MRNNKCGCHGRGCNSCCSSSSKKKQRGLTAIPFDAQVQGVSTVVPTSPTTFNVHTEGSGTHPTLGVFTIVADEVVTVDAGTIGVDARGRITNGTVTLTFADGSTITRTYQGLFIEDVNSPIVNFLSAGPIIGGTGRFAGATGTLVAQGTVNLSNGQFLGSFSGTLVLPAN